MNDDNIGATVDSSKSNGNGPGNKDNKRLKFQDAGTTFYVLVGKCVGPTSDNYQIMGIDCFYAVPKAVL